MKSESNKFIWRPNDNSASTLAKYKLEAQHWTKAFTNVGRMQSGVASFSQMFGMFGLLVTLVLSILIFIFAVIGRILGVDTEPNPHKTNDHKRYRMSDEDMASNKAKFSEAIKTHPDWN